MHQVTAVTMGARYSITLYTPGKLEHLTASDWDTLAKAGFPTYLYKPLLTKRRRLPTPTHVVTLSPESKRIAESHEMKRPTTTNASHEPATVEDQLWDNIPLPSIADPTEYNLMKLKTL